MGGIEWLIEAYECDPDRLRDSSGLKNLFLSLVAGLQLKPVGEAVWHQFPHTGGLTGLLLLRESHLAIHTFPEHQSVCLNLFCCRQRSAPDWQGLLTDWLGARRIHVKECERNYVCHELPVLRR